MRRYLSLSRSSRASYTPNEKSTIPEDNHDGTASTINGEGTEVNSSTAALVAPPATLPPPNLKVKRVDYYYSNWSKTWKYRNTGSKVTPEASHLISSSSSGNDPWQSFCFVVVRKMPRSPEEGEPTFQVVIKSPYLVEGLKHVIQNVPGISWTADPLELDPQLLIAFLPQLEAYVAELKGKKSRSLEDNFVSSALGVLIDYISRDYRGTIAKIKNLTSHGEITFDLLYSVMVPRTILVTECPNTGEPRALQLVSATKVKTMGVGFYDLLCESVDAVDHTNNGNPNEGWNANNTSSLDQEVNNAGLGKSFGRVQNRVIIAPFKGTVPINSLDAYPFKYHVNEEALRKKLLARGEKWVGLKGIHHMQYKASASLVIPLGNGCKKVVRYNVNSRIMVDRANFKRLNPNYELPVIKQTNNNANATPVYDPYGNQTSSPQDPNRGIPTLKVPATAPEEIDTELTQDELLLTSPTVYGFSLSDKIWLEFNVEQVKPITWNDEAFRSLVLPPGRKTLLQSLVEAHNADLGFDDFVKGKGHGLVINLYGPPGVGKTLSAEATSEHVRRPLYVIGGGDLGTSAGELDDALQRTFDIATSWKAIVLIDEADVFLEQRSLHDLERNAMVAVFLRHVEYYRGILFLTTNRVKTFDEAFLSRIHVALHFQELSQSAKAQVWRAFLAKVGIEVGVTPGPEDGKPEFKEEWLVRLSEKDINGRQIKNATRTANSLAVSRKEHLTFSHLMETLDAMDEFTSEFRAIGRKD